MPIDLEKIHRDWDKNLVKKWKQTGFYDFNLLTEEEQIELSSHMEKGIFSLAGQPNHVVHESLKKRCTEWVHRNDVT